MSFLRYGKRRSAPNAHDTTPYMKYTKWSPQEKELLLDLAGRYRNDFKKVALHFPGKDEKQLRYCYQNLRHKQLAQQQCFDAQRIVRELKSLIMASQ